MTTNLPRLLSVDATTAQQWLQEQRAVLFDVREPDEYARTHIPGARLIPLSSLNQTDFGDEYHHIAIFHCASGARTRQAATELLALGFSQAFYLQGGLRGWQQAGLPVQRNSRAPISLMRQVQIIVGTLVLLGILLGVSVSPWFLLLSAAVGGGLLFAGLSGICALASLLALLPYNRRHC